MRIKYLVVLLFVTALLFSSNILSRAETLIATRWHGNFDVAIGVVQTVAASMLLDVGNKDRLMVSASAYCDGASTPLAVLGAVYVNGNLVRYAGATIGYGQAQPVPVMAGVVPYKQELLPPGANPVPTWIEFRLATTTGSIQCHQIWMNVLHARE